MLGGKKQNQNQKQALTDSSAAESHSALTSFSRITLRRALFLPNSPPFLLSFTHTGAKLHKPSQETEMLEKAKGKHAQSVTATSVHFVPADEFSGTERRLHGKCAACFNFTVITLREGMAAHICVGQLQHYSDCLTFGSLEDVAYQSHSIEREPDPSTYPVW